jgi:hypothetical protein
MRSGRLSTRSRRTATWKTKPTIPGATAGTMWPLTRSTGWCWAWSSANAAARTCWNC